MKKGLIGCLMLILTASCQRSSSQTWEDIKTAGRYFNRSIDSLCGKEYDSPYVAIDDNEYGDEFIALNEGDIQKNGSDMTVLQPSSSPGQKGIPYLDQFKNPNGSECSLFSSLHFQTDDHVIRGQEDLYAVQKIAAYLKRHKNVYLCVEGHCDERASAAYNMALGTRRANHLRVLLIQSGIDFNRIYTVSHGKEKPLVSGHSPDDWQKNRRVAFKLFTK